MTLFNEWRGVFLLIRDLWGYSCMLRITSYSRFGRQAASVRTEVRRGIGEAFSVAGKQKQPDIPAPPNRIAASRFAPLGWWGVVNTRTQIYRLSSVHEYGEIQIYKNGKEESFD
jgi:hypothetical protein